MVPTVLPSGIRHVIMSMMNHTKPGPDRIRPVSEESIASSYRQARSIVHMLPVRMQGYQSRKDKLTVLLHKNADLHDIGNYRSNRSISLLSFV